MKRYGPNGYTDDTLCDDIPEQYIFSKRFADLCDKALELGFKGHLDQYGNCQYDVNMDNMFGDGWMPGCYEGHPDPMGDYLALMMVGFVWDLANHCVNEGLLPEDTEGLICVHTPSNPMYPISVTIKPGKESDVLKKIMKIE